MKNQNQPNNVWGDNVMVVDAAHLNRVAFDLTVNFERMLDRRIPPADLARWADCAALDGGVRQGEESTSVILIHDANVKSMDCFVPSDFEKEIGGQSFKDHLGEFTFSLCEVGSLTTPSEVFLDVIAHVLLSDKVKRLVVVPDDRDEDLLSDLRRQLSKAPEALRVTLLAMQPVVGGNFRQEILGYSLMAALGIKGEELR